MNTLLHEYHARLGAALEGDNRLAAIEKLHAEMEARIAALEPMAQATMFTDGEDTPLFTLPDDLAEPEWVTAFNQSSAEPSAPAEPLPCSKCNRHPSESGLSDWAWCMVCNAAVCDTCAWHDDEGNGHFCSPECAYGVDENQNVIVP